MNDLTEESFVKASRFVRKKAKEFSPENLLYLYSRFKQANEGKCNVPKPYFFDFQGKQKWEAWKCLGDMPKDEAMEEYINYLAQLFPDWEDGIDENDCEEDGGGGGLGVTVSRMVSDEQELADCDKTVVDWCKEGNIQNVTKRFENKKTLNEINTLDEEGLSLLHWASDRGLSDMVSLLLSYEADANVQDSDGQTPLHFAVECQYLDVVKVLLDSSANLQIKDCEGITPLDIDTSPSIKCLLDSHLKLQKSQEEC